MVKHVSLDGLNLKKGISFLTVNHSIIQENDFLGCKNAKIITD